MDEYNLWRIPDRYAEAMKECGGYWGKLLIPFLGRSNDPQHILSRIGDTLSRLDLRVVVFVDDFDRTEGDSPTTQQAVAKALNQFQAVPNLQYVIAVGPTGGQERQTAEGRVSWDLLKLTRYQELVPRLKAGDLVDWTKKCRDRAQEDPCYSYPWAYLGRNQTDPLAFHGSFESICSTSGLIGIMIGLLNTPRACKAMLRETMKAWESGLKGEIDWYDLLLINAIRVAEPGVFEWIARDSHTFCAEVPVLNLPSRHNEEQKEAARYAVEVLAQLETTVSTREPKRLTIVKEAISLLFPDFHAAILHERTGNRVCALAEAGSQKICLRVGSHSDYLRRFFAGCVPPEDVPDQPTLQYIKRIILEGFEPSEFIRLYLDSLDKLTGPLNKVVQFAMHVEPGVAYQICDTILDWIADPAHAIVWPQPEAFLIDMLPDVLTIAERPEKCRELLTRHIVGAAQTVREELAHDRFKWTELVIKRYMPRAPLLALRFAASSHQTGWALVVEQVPGIVFTEFRRNFIEHRLPILPCLTISRFSLAWLLNDLLLVVDRNEYSTIKSELTGALLSETRGPDGQRMMEQIIFSLLETLTPTRSSVIGVEEYQFTVDKRANETKYDVDMILADLSTWTVIGGDPLVKKALSHLRSGYHLEG